MSTLPALPPVHDPQREALVDAVLCAEEIERRRARERCLFDTKFLCQVLYPPDDPLLAQVFWAKFGEAQEFNLQLRWAFKARQQIVVPSGFTVISHGRKPRRLDRDEEFDLSEFVTLHIRMSRETLKTSLGRVDAVHDLVFFPFVRNVACASNWMSHKKGKAIEQGMAIKAIACKTRFADLFPDVIPKHRNPDKWGTQERFNALNRPHGAPEPTFLFIGADQIEEGGRYRLLHADDVVTFDDRDSPTIREQTKLAWEAKEGERDATMGLKIAVGTDHHPQDLYQKLEKSEDTFTIKMPCILGPAKKFFEFCALKRRDRELMFREYTRECKPVFRHLHLHALVQKFRGMDRPTFASQMLLDPKEGGRTAFVTAEWSWIKREDVPNGLACDLFMDPKFSNQGAKKAGDKCAILVVMWQPRFRRRIYVDGYYRDEWDEDRVWSMCGELIRKWKIRRFFFEKNRQVDLNNRWQDFALKNGISPAVLTPLLRAGVANKHARIVESETDYRNGSVVLVEGVEINNAILEEASDYDRFSGAGLFDDALDVGAQPRDPAVRAGFDWSDQSPDGDTLPSDDEGDDGSDLPGWA